MTNWLLRSLGRWPTANALLLAAVLGLGSLALIAWAVLQPNPIPVLASMSLAPVLGAVAFLLFAMSVAADLAQQSSARMIRTLSGEHCGTCGKPLEPPTRAERARKP